MSERKSLIRLASEMPAGSPERKALLEVLAGDMDIPSQQLSMRGEKAGKLIAQMAKNLQQAMQKKEDPADIQKWMFRLFGAMLKEGMHPALDGWHPDLAQQAYALGQKMQQRKGASNKEAAAPQGAAQKAIMDYLSNPQLKGEVKLTDMSKDQSFRGMHFSKIMSAMEALAKKGLITHREQKGEGDFLKLLHATEKMSSQGASSAKKALQKLLRKL